MPSTFPVISAAGLGVVTLQPLPDVTPFTIRSGPTYESILSGIRVWIRDELVPYLSEHSAEATFQGAIDTLTDMVNHALGDQAATVNAALNQAVQEIVTADIPITNALLAAAGIYVAPPPIGGGADDTANVQAAITAAQQGNGEVALHAGTYNVTDLVTAAGFAQPIIRGRGMQYTTINVTQAGGHGIKFNGGSGRPGGGRIADLKIIGAGATGVTFQGVNHCYAERVWFKGLAVGVKFHNESTGNFTEFDQLIDCKIDNDVVLPIWYARSNAVESFHGSGFVRTNIAAPVAGGPAVQIDAGCFVYGAPFDGTIFGQVNGQVMLVNNSTRHHSVRGVLDFEIQGNATGVVAGGGTGGNIALQGSVGGLGGTASDLTTGKLILAERVHYTGGSTFISPKPWVENKALGPGTTNLLTSTSIAACLIHVEINAPNYNWVGTLLVWRDSFNGNNGGATIIATHKALDTVGYGVPVFGYANGIPTVTNANYPASGVVAYSDVIPFNHERSDLRMPRFH